MKIKNYYEILDVNRKSSKDEIKTKFRKLAKLYHPDSRDDNNIDDNKFKDINEAYDVLMNEEKRKKYDRQSSRYGFGFLANETPLSNIKYEFKSSGQVFGDILNTLLGIHKTDDTHFSEVNIDNKQKPQKGRDITSNLEISLNEGLIGTEKKIAIKGYKGGIKTFTVNVPVGIHNGDKIRLAALGNPGKNGGKNGDLIINVKVNNLTGFELKGNDLIQEIYISPAEAILGTSYKTKVFDDTVIVKLPKYLKNGEYITYKSKGYISKECVRGNLLLHINIKMPTNITEREEHLYEQIYKIEHKKY